MRCRSIFGLLLVGMLLSIAAPQPAPAQPGTESYNALLDNFSEANRDGRYRDAERYARQIKAIDEQFAPDDLSWNLFLGMALKGQGRNKEAQPLMETFVGYCRRKHGESEITVEGLLSLGAVYLQQNLLKQAQPVLEEAVQMGKKVLGPNHSTTLASQQNLALMFQYRGELQRAAQLYREVIDGNHRSGENDTDRLIPILNLVNVYSSQGRYDNAESMARYGLALAPTLGATIDNPRVIMLVHNLGGAYVAQNRAAEGRPLLEGALAAAERNLGRDHPEVGSICGDLSTCYVDLNEREQGIVMLKRAIENLSATVGDLHPTLCVQYYNLGWLYLDVGKPTAAEPVLRKALDITEKNMGAHHWQTAETRAMLADVLLAQNKDNEAELLLQMALTDLESSGIGKTHRHEVMRSQARLMWKRGDQAGGVKRLQEAIELADESRADFGGAEVERAAASSKFTGTYDIMLGWQAELRNASGAFDTLERIRARTFLESMTLAGVDLFQGRTAAEKTQSQQLESELNSQVSKLEDELSNLPAPAEKEGPEVTQRRRTLNEALFKARDDLYTFQRDLRSSSPVYRQLIATQPKPPNLAEVQKELVPEKTILLSYCLGNEQSRVLAIRSTDSRLLELKISEEDAGQLGVCAGPLTRELLQQVLLGKSKTAVLARLAQREPIDDMLPKLHALWHVLFPPELRAEITSGDLERLIILPDGALALLPMEALVVNPGPDLVYLLDVAPPIQYGPSAAVLMSLAGRPVVAPQNQAVLTLGDPLYGRPQPAAAAQNNLLGLAARGSRSASIRQNLYPLPFSGTESRWVAEVFKKAGIDSVQLLGANATEAQVRAQIAGREIIHLACHGMSDDAYGNFFGMLALAPGAQAANPQDDGMLTLKEIFGLNLRGCEMAILSACMTNHGPEQRGEGVWALSRGFLVAGARRVIASDWVVDDEAGASLISVCCAQLADARKNQQPADYAHALWKAKSWVRKQEKWQSPYFWAPFVLVGPN